MVYLVGVLGFVGGFIAGQMLLYLWLKDRPKSDLLNDKKLAWTYGVMNWIIAAIGSYSFIFLYNQYFN